MNVRVRLNVADANNLDLTHNDLFDHGLVSLISLYKVQAQMTVKTNVIEVDFFTTTLLYICKTIKQCSVFQNVYWRIVCICLPKVMIIILVQLFASSRVF